MSDQTDKMLGDILATLDDQTQLLRDILAALKSSARPAASQAANHPANSPQTGPEVYPKPMRVISIEDAEATVVHFGKNNGLTLGSLSEKSVSWYAMEKPPQLKKDGTPFDPRPQDVALSEAARTLHHARAGNGAAPAATKPKEAPKQAEIDDSSVPF